MSDIRYTRAIAETICARLSEGESLRAVCRSPGMPTEGGVRSWARLDVDGFASRYRLARELQLDAWSDLIIDVADNGELEPRDRQVRIDARKWITSKLAPRRYGDRLLHASDPESPLRVLHEQVSLDHMSADQLDAVERLAQAMLAKRGGG